MHEQEEFPFRSHLTDIETLMTRLQLVPHSGPLVEHLGAACGSLRQEKPNECMHRLVLALASAQTLPQNSGMDEETSAEVSLTIERLLRNLRADQPGVKAPQERFGLAEFFNDDEVSFGIFYPKEHLVAVFLSPSQAAKGLSYLRTAGLRVWEAITVSGKEVLQFLEGLQANEVLWTTLNKELPRVPGTTASTIDSYTWWAKRGAGFLIAHSPTGAAAQHISELLAPAGPVAMHWFMSGFIRELT